MIADRVSQYIYLYIYFNAQNFFHKKFYFMPLHVSSMCSKCVEARNKTYCETNFVHQVG